VRAQKGAHNRTKPSRPRPRRLQAPRPDDATGIPLAITAYNPPRQLEIRGQLGPFPSRLSYALDAIPEGTRVTNSVELELRGPGRLLGRVAVPRVRDAVAANLQKLKELLEG
jgi:hypothetical protein